MSKLTDWLFSPIVKPLEEKISAALQTKSSPIDLSQYLIESDIEDSDEIITDPYKQSPVVNIAVNKISSTAARVPLKFYDSAGEEIDPPLCFDGIDSVYTVSQFVQACIAWQELRGEFIILPRYANGQKSFNKEPDFFLLPDPKQFTSEPTSDLPITSWSWQTPTGSETFLPAELIHYHTFTPYSMYRGTDPLVAMHKTMQEDSLATISNKALLKNRSVPDGVLSTDQTITPEEAKDLQNRWLSQHSNKNKFRIAVMGNGTKFQPIGLNPADMEFFQLRQWNRSTIMGFFGVPPAISGYKDENTPLSGNDTKEQIEQFWYITIIPKLETLESVINKGIMDKYYPGSYCAFDYSEIHELQTDQSKIDEENRADVLAGLKTINEVREADDKEPVEWGDVWWRSSSLTSSEEEPEEPENIMDNAQEIIPPTEEEKSSTWWGLYKDIEPVIVKTKKTISEWLFEQRAAVLQDATILSDDKFRDSQKVEIRNKIAEILKSLSPTIQASLAKDYIRLGITDPVVMEMKSVLDKPLTEVSNLVDVVSDQALEYGNPEQLRQIYRTAQAKSSEAAELLIYNFVNDSRTTSFRQNAVKYHQYISARDNFKTKSSVDGEIVEIGEDFSIGISTPGAKDISMAIWGR